MHYMKYDFSIGINVALSEEGYIVGSLPILACHKPMFFTANNYGSIRNILIVLFCFFICKYNIGETIESHESSILFILQYRYWHKNCHTTQCNIRYNYMNGYTGINMCLMIVDFLSKSLSQIYNLTSEFTRARFVPLLHTIVWNLRFLNSNFSV